MSNNSMPNKDKEIIRLVNISKNYSKKKNTVYALTNVSLNIYEGDFIAIMGESGAGKSTLLNIIGLIDSPTKGNYYLYNSDTNNLDDKEKSKMRNKKIGFIVQDYGLIDHYTVFENVEIPLLYSSNKLSKVDKKTLVVELLRTLGIEDKINTMCNELSGGQKQRVAIARALVNNPQIIIADEPTGSLDKETSSEIMDIFEKINREDNITVIIVTHDPEIALNCNRLIKISNGCLEKDPFK